MSPESSVSERFSLAGRTALVTGAGSGLGRAAAVALAEAGAWVACLDIDPAGAADTARRTGGGACALDVSDAEAVEEAVGGLAEERGRLDVLVNSAGIAGRGAAVSHDEAAFDRLLAVNLKGTFLMCRAAGRRMAEAGGGSIVNIASIAGLVGYPGSVGYQASKGGVVQLTRTLAVEWAEAGVRVNAVAPGHIATELVRKMWETEPELRDFFLSRTPMARLGEPEDVAGPILFLAGEAAAMITGQILAVDGGYTSQ